MEEEIIKNMVDLQTVVHQEEIAEESKKYNPEIIDLTVNRKLFQTQITDYFCEQTKRINQANNTKKLITIILNDSKNKNKNKNNNRKKEKKRKRKRK